MSLMELAGTGLPKSVMATRALQVGSWVLTAYLGTHATAWIHERLGTTSATRVLEAGSALRRRIAGPIVRLMAQFGLRGVAVAIFDEVAPIGRTYTDALGNRQWPLVQSGNTVWDRIRKVMAFLLLPLIYNMCPSPLEYLLRGKISRTHSVVWRVLMTALICFSVRTTLKDRRRITEKEVEETLLHTIDPHDSDDEDENPGNCPLVVVPEDEIIKPVEFPDQEQTRKPEVNIRSQFRSKFVRRCVNAGKAKFGKLEFTLPNEKMLHDFYYELMRKQHVRASHMAMMLPVCVALTFAPNESEVLASDIMDSARFKWRLEQVRVKAQKA